MSALIEAPKGLEGVVVAETTIGDVRGEEGFYHYRQYSAVELAESKGLEDVWFLLTEGELPTLDERERFTAQVAPLRVIPPETMSQLPGLVQAGDGFEPLPALRTAVSLVAQELGLRATLDLTQEQLHADVLRVCAVVPSLVAALWRLHNGLQPLDPQPELPYATNYLQMITGQRPDEADARAIEQYLIATVDHGFNSSTFTARVIASTGADLGSAIVGAIGALSGPLHGGAPSRALDLLDAIGTPGRAEQVIRDQIRAGGRVMGFGHRVYKTEDPRVGLLRDVAHRLGGERAAFAQQVEQTVVRVLAQEKPGRHLYANVEFYAGVVMERCGLPRSLFTPTFAASRTIGWCAHVLEQAAGNRLFRPSARYVGAPPHSRTVGPKSSPID